MGANNMTSVNIPHLRMANQRLSSPIDGKPEQVLSWLGAVQAQDYAGSKWALGLRLQGATENDIEQAYTHGSILRTHLMRPTWHYVTPADIRWLLALTAPRLHAVNAFRHRQLELEAADFERSESAFEKALQGGRQLTRDELRQALERAGVRLHLQQRMAYLLMHAELEGVICSGPRRGKQFTYMLLEERVPPTRSLSGEEALAELVRRYFTSRGPATLRDFVWWSGLTTADARSGLEMVQGQLSQQEIDGKAYWFSDAASAPAEPSQAAYLLPNYDEYTISYLDRRQVSGAASREQSLLNQMVLINGQLAGTWKRALKKEAVEIEMSTFTSLSKADRQLVEAAAQRYGTFLGLPMKLK
jgi:hypothetical protein